MKILRTDFLWCKMYVDGACSVTDVLIQTTDARGTPYYRKLNGLIRYLRHQRRLRLKR